MVDLRVLTAKNYEEMRRGGIEIRFGFHDSPFGKCLVALHGKSVCHLSFVVRSESENLKCLGGQWPGCDIINEERRTGKIVKEIFSGDANVGVTLRGTPFEGKVWEALLSIPKGRAASYGEVAVMIGHDKAVRAVANAVAKNPVTYLIPCHRVIGKNGNLHKYKWGSTIKKKILESENCYF